MGATTLVGRRALTRELATRIRRRRKEFGWSQWTLAERAGTTQATISRIEHGIADGAPFWIIAAACKALRLWEYTPPILLSADRPRMTNQARPEIAALLTLMRHHGLPALAGFIDRSCGDFELFGVRVTIHLDCDCLGGGVDILAPSEWTESDIQPLVSALQHALGDAVLPVSVRTSGP